MRTGLIAEKVGMTQLFSADGTIVPVTVLRINNCCVIGKKVEDGRDGYNAIQIGAGTVQPNVLTKPLREMFAKRNLEPKAHIKEFRVSPTNLLEVGSVLAADHFEVGQKVDVTGTSIGKGFAGAMKRHNFGGLVASHGVSVSHRSHGSTGNSQDPGRVFKNKKMAGHMGARRVTKLNLTVHRVDTDKSLVFIKGSVPGPKGAVVYVRDAIKR